MKQAGKKKEVCKAGGPIALLSSGCWATLRKSAVRYLKLSLRGMGKRCLL